LQGEVNISKTSDDLHVSYEFHVSPASDDKFGTQQKTRRRLSQA